MSIVNKRIDRYSLVSRLIAHQTEQGVALDKAVSQLSEVLPKEYSAEISAIQKAANGGTEITLGFAHNHSKIFNRLSKLVIENGGQVEKLFPVVQIFLRDTENLVKEFWGGFYSLVTYLLAVTVIGMFVLSIFVLKVGPEILNAFTAFNHQLPQLSEFIFVHHEFYLLSMLVGIILIVLCFLTVRNIRTSINNLLPFPRWMVLLPIVRSLKDIYEYFLVVHYTDLFLKSGVSQDVSLKAASQLISNENPTPKNIELKQGLIALDAAKEMNCFLPEIEFQKKQINILFCQSVVSTREQLTLFAQVLLGCIIAVMLMAMYLPIFQLGSIAGE